MDCAAYLGKHKPVFNSHPRQVTLLVLLMSIINLIKNSEKEPKIKRVWLMTLPQIPKKIRYGAQTLTCFWGHVQWGQACWIALTEKTLVFRALRQTYRYSIAINVNHHGTTKARLGHNPESIRTTLPDYNFPISMSHSDHARGWNEKNQKKGHRKRGDSSPALSEVPPVAYVNPCSYSWDSSY